MAVNSKAVSLPGLFFLATNEAIVIAPYLDGGGVWTYGVGHTRGAGHPHPAAMPRGNPADVDSAVMGALTLFANDIRKYAGRVNAAINVTMLQPQFDALVDFDFNTGGIHRANLTSKLNASNVEGCRHQGRVGDPDR